MNRTTVDDRYTLARPIGSGGMAEVFLAHDGVLDRDVALKILRGQYAHDEEFAERFRREAKSAASLSHPNIVQVYDRGDTEDGSSYIAMEYVPGGTLKERLDERGPLEPDRALAVTAQVAGALWAAHEGGVIHRDIKPQNVLVTDMGHLKVTDFGIARAASAATISATNSVFGTAAYLSPEQALGEPATPRSDLYSLGIVLYEMLTGAVPYRADNPVAVCMKHVTEPLRPPRKLDPAIPAAVDALVVKMLAKDPADRPAGAPELLDDIERVRGGSPPPLPTPRTKTPRLGVPAGTAATHPAPAPARTTRLQRARPPGRRARKTMGAILACALLGIALLGAATLGLSDGPEEVTLNRVQDVARGGLAAPTPGVGGPGDGGAGNTPPQPPGNPPPASTPPASSPPASTPPASAPPASAPPDEGPGQSQYAGDG